MLLALVVSWLICFDQDKSSVMFTPRYFVVLVAWSFFSMELIIMYDGFFLICDTGDFAFVWIKGHKPLLLPSF